MSSKALAKIEHLPAISVQADGRLATPSWPAWLVSRTDVLEHAYRRVSGKLTDEWRIPESKMLTPSMQREVQLSVARLAQLASMTPLLDEDAEKTTLVLITKMLKVLSGPRLDEIGAEASGEAYMMALEDVPCWAVANALRRWYRNEVGEKHDTKWRPAPGELRDIALTEASRVDAPLRKMRGLLDAQPVQELSDEHRAIMLKRLADLLRGLFADREDPITRMRREARENAERQLAEDKSRALAEIAAAEKSGEIPIATAGAS